MRLPQSHVHVISVPPADGNTCRLYEQSDETVFLCVGDGLDIVYVDKIEGNDPSRVFCMVGMRIPALRTAAGRAILAFQDEDTIAHAIEAATVASSNGATPGHADVDQERERLAQIRRDGYALSFGEFRPGINSLAAPVLGCRRPGCCFGCYQWLERSPHAGATANRGR